MVRRGVYHLLSASCTIVALLKLGCHSVSLFHLVFDLRLLPLIFLIFLLQFDLELIENVSSLILTTLVVITIE